MKPISNTAFYCCGVRMQDADRPNPVCGDVHAKTFMNEEGLRILESFKNEKNPNASNVARHRIIDDLLRRAIVATPGLQVVIVGAGFDSRAYRIRGGTWIELDEPQVIQYKDERLPASRCDNELRRIPIDFANESLEEKLAPHSTRSLVAVVIEGVFMYLDEETIGRTLRTLQHLFPGHTLICDLMSRKFFEQNATSIHQTLTGMGVAFRFTADNPAELFLRSGYRLIERISIVEKAIEFNSIRMPKLLLHTVYRTLRDGYRIFVLQAA